jgi:hypothetical protein
MAEYQAKGILERDKIPKWIWTGHILRQDNESIAKKAWSGTRKKEQEKEDQWRSRA